MLLKFLTLRLKKKDCDILFYDLFLLISFKSLFVSNKRQKGNRSRLREELGRNKNSRGRGNHTQFLDSVSPLGPSPWGSGNSVEEDAGRLWEPVGMEDTEETVLPRHNGTKAHENLKRLGQCTQGLHRSKPFGILAVRWKMDTAPTRKPKPIFNWQLLIKEENFLQTPCLVDCEHKTNLMVFLEMFCFICFVLGLLFCCCLLFF